ncbi:UNVERIFIED_CONTAM: hypothetical protein RMT77_001617 [Armadillidium vulgare]
MIKAIYFVVFIALLNFSITNASNDYNDIALNMPTVIGDGQCIWYDQCSNNPDKPNDKLNCRYDGPPKKLPTTSVSVFTTTCPELVDEIIDVYGEIVTCCGPNQILTLLNHLATLTAIVENCPACVSNLRKIFCYFTCHPRHSAFVNPTLLYNDSVWTVSQYSSFIYIDEAYDSCDTVFFDQENTSALNLLCGPWGEENCTPERLFDSLGNNFLVSFNVSYIYGNYNTTAPIVEDPSQMRPIYLLMSRRILAIHRTRFINVIVITAKKCVQLPHNLFYFQ